MAKIINTLYRHLVEIISETNGISIEDTLELIVNSNKVQKSPSVLKNFNEFKRLLANYQQDEVDIATLLSHPFSSALRLFFKNFPLPYLEEHIHLTGSLTADFIYPRLMKQLKGPNGQIYLDKIREVYQDDTLEINTVEDVDALIRLKDDEHFERYLQILLLPKLILKDRQTHREAAYHMASTLYHEYNVGRIRLKFTFSRATSNSADQIPGLNITHEDAVLGLYEGFMDFKQKVPEFSFILSPCFRKEADFFDAENFETKKDHFNLQIDQILEMLEKFPFLKPYVTDVDTVGSEKELYRKSHFIPMQSGFRKLHYRGFSIRSHHGETWHTLNKGVQAVDNALNIWHIDTLEHGLSLGINPNYYFHRFFQKVMDKNDLGIPIKEKSQEGRELEGFDWRKVPHIKDKLISGVPLADDERIHFMKIKFHTAREVEHYQHDVLNRMINKDVSVIALPTSNNRLTNSFPEYKDHPFSWWEKKGVRLGIGTDNYITLNTDYLQELLILLYTDANSLKITKLLMVATGEYRRPFLSQLMWRMRNTN